MMPRRRQDELMDRPDVDPVEHRRALRGLARINALSRVVSRLDQAIQEVAVTLDRPVRVLELACGGGDTAIGLAHAAHRRTRQTEPDSNTTTTSERPGAICYEGRDISGTAIGLAQEHSSQIRAAAANDHANFDFRFVRANVLDEPLPEADIVFCSLFVHHLDEPDIFRLLSTMMNAAAKRVIVDDLRRSRWGVFMAHVGCRLLSHSPIVHFDGPVSVEGALTSDELRDLAARAGMADVRITPYWPQRMLMIWDAPA